MIPGELKELLERQHYKIVGRHSAVKVCHWTRKSLRGEGECYKQQFYGVQSHRCLQMTPAVAWCNQRCLFCWRNTEHTLGSVLADCDEPGDIIDEAVEKQRMLLSGFGGIPEVVNQRKFREAQNPNQAAISLSGEPTIYPRLGELIREFHRRDYTTFLVSNGTFPERLAALDKLPTQLYISLYGPNKEVYRKTCAPESPELWNRINESLELIPSLDTRTVIRLTLVKGLNLTDPAGYARLIEKAQPTYVEAKAFMFVGGSRMRMTIDHMPSFQEIQDFSEKLAEELGYQVKDSKEDSRVVLLARD